MASKRYFWLVQDFFGAGSRYLCTGSRYFRAGSRYFGLVQFFLGLLKIFWAGSRYFWLAQEIYGLARGSREFLVVGGELIWGLGGGWGGGKKGFGKPKI